MKLQADYLGEVASLLQDAANDLSSGDRIKALNHAVERFSRVRPRSVVADVTGNGGADYDPPSGWVDDWSSLQAIEYPVGNAPATYLEDGDFTIYKTPSAKKIRLLRIRPQAPETFRVTFTGLHSVGVGAATIGDGDFRAVCHLAAAVACQMLATRYAQLSDPTIGADSVDHKSKSFEFAQRGRDLYKVYAEHIGANRETPPPAASYVQDWDKDFGWGEDRLTHPRRWR